MSFSASGQTPGELRQQRDQLMDRGLWRDALTFYREKLDPISDENSGTDLDKAVTSLGRLEEWREFDSLVEKSVASHADQADVLRSASAAYRGAYKGGNLVGGEFQRGLSKATEPFPNGGISVDYRDHIRSLQLLVQGMKIVKDEPTRTKILQDVSQILGNQEPWKFQVLTPIETLPDWDEPGPSGSTEGAPWADDGPVLYTVPASWDLAKNDGERWRFALAELAKLNPQLAAESALQLARFSQSQFGSQTLDSFGWWRERDPESSTGILELETLTDDEVLAKTSDGVRRFKLPAEDHFISIYRSLIESPTAGGTAGDALVQVYLGRRQFPKAREVLESVIAKHGTGPADSRKLLLNQIIGNWGLFGQAQTVAEGSRPKIPLLFRNARSVKFTASPVDMDAVLADTIDYLKTNPREVEWERVNPSAIASRIIAEEKSKFLGEPAATWEQTLVPEKEYRDTRAEVEVPLEKAGAWWINAEVSGGNHFSTLVWIVDDVLVQRDVAGSKQWWAADAANGAPMSATEIEFFGYQVINRQRKTPLERRIDVATKSLSRTTDDDGKVLLKPGDLDPNFEWMAIARRESKVTAFFGFQPFVIDEPQFENGNRDVSYGITDRPLYQPGDKLHAKFYLRNVGYFEPDESKYSNRMGTLTLFNGRGEEALKIPNLKTDELGAIESEVVLPKDAALGSWQAVFAVENAISASVGFQVEEFRKPEYEVTVEAPKEPVKLGGKFTATIKAAYFHGAPVRDAEVTIVVKRSSLHDRWFPAGPWDWLYGRGSWWPGTDSSWHPNWNAWSCIPPSPRGNGRRWTPDEMVMSRSVKIGSDGTASVEIDTASAKEIHGDMDSQYTIEASVTDASRRVEKGRGRVIAARKPFEVVIWTDRGFTQPGQPIEARISVATLDGRPVKDASGTLRLFKLSIDGAGKVVETEAASWPVKTDADGKVVQPFQAPDAGQYRLAANLSLQGGEASEGATIVNVFGPGKSEPDAWKFGPLELLMDKLTYAQGEELKLRINSDKSDAHVWLFLHVGGASGREAKRIQLDGKSLEIAVPLDRRDMPNMFIEAVTVHGAQIFSSYREVLLPPESQLIEVTLTPEKMKVGPRETSNLQISLRDSEGKPVVGKAVLAVYDKALEAITGGSNVLPIAEPFWGWKNYYYAGRSSCSVPNAAGNLLRPKQIGMDRFGHGFDEVLQLQRGSRFKDERAIPRMMLAAAALAPAADGFEKGGAPEPPVPVMVRKDFADLLKWSGEITMDAEGKASVPLEFPDNLTTWKARVWVVGSGSRVGEGSAEIVASKDLLVRLQAPRFLVERDETLLGAIVHNDHEMAKQVTISLEIEGDSLSAVEGKSSVVEIAARSEARVEWKVKAQHEGVAKIRMRALTDGGGDAVERDLPVQVNGMLRQDAWSRVIEPEQESAKISIEVPDKLRPDETKLTVRFSPTIAGSVVDAIPYLASYPYGCTEQTLNRFLPAVIAQRMLVDLKVDLEEVRLKRTNLNSQELGDAKDRATRWKQWQTNPIFNQTELQAMTKAGMDRLISMQNHDGGWGWFSGAGEQSYPHTTAVVMHGLSVGRAAGLEVNDRVHAGGLNWLRIYELQQVAALNRFAKREAAMKAGQEPAESTLPEKAKVDALDALICEELGRAGALENREMLDFLFRDRVDLPPYGLALLGIQLHRENDAIRRDEVMKIISQFVKQDVENQSAYVDLKNEFWWTWYGSAIETNAWYLQLLSAVKPNDPETRGVAKYLVNNRRGGSYWQSTRDTAYAIEAIVAFVKASGETAPDTEVDVLLDGKSIGKCSITRENLFSFDGTVTLTGKSVTPGKHEVEIHRSGKGALYANAYLQVFTLEDRLRAAGLEVKVQRHVSKISRVEKTSQTPDGSGTVTSQQEERVKKELLADGAIVSSGDEIEVELVLESKNDYEYLRISDGKAAGFEAVEALSGYVDAGTLSAYMEPRDRTVDFFIRSLPRGIHTLRYRLRAEAPGIYKALPATAEAMYAPELRGNSADFKLGVKD